MQVSTTYNPPAPPTYGAQQSNFMVYQPNPNVMVVTQQNQAQQLYYPPSNNDASIVLIIIAIGELVNLLLSHKYKYEK